MSLPGRSPVLFVILMSFPVIAFGYENAYDLLERRSHRNYYEPRNFQTSESYDRNRFFVRNRNPYPTRPNFIGNGYDNLGNGVPSGRFHPFGHKMTFYTDSWRFDQRPIRGSHLEFEGHPFVRTSQRIHPNYYPRDYYPNSISRIYGNEFGERGNSGVAKVDRFVEDNEDKKQKKADEIFQHSQEGVNRDSVRKEKTGEQLQTDQSGENKSRLRSNKVVKKGYTTRGFASHHHKDETGNSTTFFDESSDFGGQSDERDVADGFNTRKTLEQISNTGDEKFFRENGGQTGNYETGLLIGNQRFQKDFSTSDVHQEVGDNFQNAKENENLGQRKSFQYLNGDSFDYSEPHTGGYYFEIVD